MFPVVFPPMVRVAFLKDCIVPEASRDSPVVPAESDAVGVRLPAIFMKAILAEVVDVPPKRRSSVMFVGDRAWEFL